MDEIYHFPSKEVLVDDLLSEGLKSREQLIKEGKSNPVDMSNLFNDHLSNIYFQWLSPHLEIDMEKNNWVSIEVDSETTSVFNRELRPFITSWIPILMGVKTKSLHDYENKLCANKYIYDASRMSLADYILQHKITKEMMQDLKQEQMIVWHPLTAKPIIIGVDDPRSVYPKWQYLNEILVPRSIIQSSEFKRYHKIKSD